MSVIDIKNLTKDYGDQKGIFDISFFANAGGDSWVSGGKWSR